MKSSRFGEFVQLRNSPNSPFFQIPASIADLLQKQLGLTTGGRATHGLRWESNEVGLIFLEDISSSAVSIYVLPTTFASWRNSEALREILRKEGLFDICDQIAPSGGGKHLRIKNLSWGEAYTAIPILVKWSFASQTGRDFPFVRV